MKKTGKCYLVKGDMFADGLVILLPERNAEFYKKLVKGLVKIEDAELNEWCEMFEINKKCKGYVAVRELDNDGKYQVVVFTNEPKWKATLAHECLHAAERMCEHRHIPISKDTEELRAMLVGKILEVVDL